MLESETAMADKLFTEGQMLDNDDLGFLNLILVNDPELTEDQGVKLKTIYERNFGYGIDDGNDGRYEV